MYQTIRPHISDNSNLHIGFSGLVYIVKIKESRNRPGVAQSVPGGLGSQISRHLAREGDEVVSLTHRPGTRSRLNPQDVM